MTGIKDTRKGCTNRGTGGHKMHRNLKEGRKVQDKTRQDRKPRTICPNRGWKMAIEGCYNWGIDSLLLIQDRIIQKSEKIPN